MRLWGLIKLDNKTVRDTVIDYPGLMPGEVKDWDELIGDICRELDLSRPVTIIKHMTDLLVFSHTFYKPEDFLEPVDFDKLEIRIIYANSEKK